MPRPFKKSRRVVATGDVACPLATETVIATLNGVSTQSADATVDLDGWFQLTTGVGATTVTPRIRRNGLGGTLVGEGNTVASPASSPLQFSISVQDNPGDVAGQTYVLTATCAGVAGTMNQAELNASVS